MMSCWWINRRGQSWDMWLLDGQLVLVIDLRRNLFWSVHIWHQTSCNLSWILGSVGRRVSSWHLRHGGLSWSWISTTSIVAFLLLHVIWVGWCYLLLLCRDWLWPWLIFIIRPKNRLFECILYRPIVTNVSWRRGLTEIVLFKLLILLIACINDSLRFCHFTWWLIDGSWLLI